MLVSTKLSLAELAPPPRTLTAQRDLTSNDWTDIVVREVDHEMVTEVEASSGAVSVRSGKMCRHPADPVGGPDASPTKPAFQDETDDHAARRSMHNAATTPAKVFASNIRHSSIFRAPQVSLTAQENVSSPALRYLIAQSLPFSLNRLLHLLSS